MLETPLFFPSCVWFFVRRKKAHFWRIYKKEKYKDFKNFISTAVFFAEVGRNTGTFGRFKKVIIRRHGKYFFFLVLVQKVKNVIVKYSVRKKEIDIPNEQGS